MEVEARNQTNRRRMVIGVCVFLALGTVLTALAYGYLFSPPQRRASAERFVIPIGGVEDLGSSLQSAGLIRSAQAFDFFRMLTHKPPVVPGGYLVSRAMSVAEISQAFALAPYLRWVVIPEGLRKEEIAGILERSLGWNDSMAADWVTTVTAAKPDYSEGVYFPDTYLIPSDEAPKAVAARLQAHFEEEFAPLSPLALKQNIKWTTVVKIASIIQREAAGSSDMPLISGILWNRLQVGMALGVDSTIQYARGDRGKGWWAPITLADKTIDSPYNTYRFKGLPPHPISNPGLEALRAALFPATTTCFYYLHDPSKNIHCAVTYAEHQANIAKYLSN